MQLPRTGELFAGRYRLTSQLGAGGFALVYRATDELAGGEVAVKLLKPTSERERPEQFARFRREVKLLGTLDHPHIVKLLNSGESEDGVLYAVFELIDGRDIGAVLAEYDALSEPLANQIVSQVLGALHAAHSVGLLHRDLKPENVMVLRDDRWTVKLVDFGIAREVAGHDHLTQTGQLIGTPRYMSPEQLSGQPLGPPSDLYSLGLMWLELLVGRAGLPSNRIEDQVHRLTTTDALRVPHSVSRRTREIIERLLSPNAAARYQSAAAVLRALDPNAQRVILADKPQTVALAGVAAIVLLLGVAAFVLSMDDDTGPTPRQSGVRKLSGLVAGLDAGVPPEPEAPKQPDMAADLRRVETVKRRPVIDGLGASGCGQRPAVTRKYVTTKIYDSTGREVAFAWPKRYRADEKLPVVLLFHERSESAVRLITAMRAAEFADEHRVLVVAPRDRRHLGAKVWTDDSPVRITSAALALANETFCVDTKQIYAVGFGDGGKLVEALSCEMEELRGSASAGFRSLVAPACEPVAHMQIVGSESKVNPEQGGINCWGEQVPSKAEDEARWLRRNHCTSGGEPFDGGIGDCLQYDCAEPYVSCTIPGGHGFADSDPGVLDANCYGRLPPPGQLDAIWTFFQSLPTAAD